MRSFAGGYLLHVGSVDPDSINMRNGAVFNLVDGADGKCDRAAVRRELGIADTFYRQKVIHREPALSEGSDGYERKDYENGQYSIHKVTCTRFCC